MLCNEEFFLSNGWAAWDRRIEGKIDVPVTFVA
jgi:hypothetical protein